MKRLFLTVFAILLGCTVTNGAQPHHFHARFNSWNGLPEAYLSSVCQDAFGRLWVGSKDGVFYYTGEEFVPFTNADYLAHCASITQAVRLDADGCVWIVTAQGSGYYDVSTDRFTPLENLQGTVISDVDISADGTHPHFLSHAFHALSCHEHFEPGLGIWIRVGVDSVPNKGAI